MVNPALLKSTEQRWYNSPVEEACQSLGPSPQGSILEAMEMERSIRATRAGLFKERKVTGVQVVPHGSVLIEFE